MKFAVVVLLVAAVAPLVLPAKLPSYIKSCKKNDPKLNECALKNGREALPYIIQGDPKFGIPKLDPLVISKIVVGDARTGPGGLGLAFSCENCIITGLKGIQAKAVRVDLKKRHLEVEGSVPRVEVKGRYTAKGKVLVLPIEGNGQAEIVVRNLHIVYKVDYDLKKGKDGKDYARIKNSNIGFKADGFNIKLTNLFKGDKKLGDQMNKFLNESWRDVMNEFGPAISESVKKVLTLILNNISQKVPYDEIVIN